MNTSEMRVSYVSTTSKKIIVNEAILVRAARSKGVTQTSVLFRGDACNAVGVVFYNNYFRHGHVT